MERHAPNILFKKDSKYEEHYSIKDGLCKEKSFVHFIYLGSLNCVSVKSGQCIASSVLKQLMHCE